MGWFQWPKLSHDQLTSERAQSEEYKRRVGNPGALFHYEDRPPFSAVTAELMMFDHKVTLALAIRNGLLAQMEIEVVGGPPGIREYVARQWEKIWTLAGPVIVEAKHIGWTGFEPMFEPGDANSPDAGRAMFCGYRDFHPRDIRPLVSEGKIVGLTLNNCQNGAGGKLALFAPKGCWITYKDRYSNYYGQSLVEHAYAPWHEKWQRGGAIKLRQLRMMKDAWVGDILRYPTNRRTLTPGGEVVSWRDVAREIIQLRQSGGVMGIPSDRTADGNYEWEYTGPTAVEGATPIHEYKKELDLEIVEGLEVPGEVLETAEGGNAYNGRTIPMVGLLAALQTEGEGYARQVDQQIIRPLVRWEFGCAPSYQIKVKPLIETIQQLMGGGEKEDGGRGSSSIFSGFGFQRPPASPQSAGDSPPVGASAEGYGNSQFSAGDSRARTCNWRDRLTPRQARPLCGSTVGGVYYRPGEWISPAALQFASDAELLQLAGDGGGSSNGERWVTIGGRKGDGGEHVGGFPVKLDKDGNIIAGGPRGMRGMHVTKSGSYFAEQKATREKSGEDKFAGVADFFDEKREEVTAAKKEAKTAAEKDALDRAPGNTRSLKKIMAYQAEQWGMSEETYAQFMDEVWGEHIQDFRDRENLKDSLRKMLGKDAGDLKRVENRGGKDGRGGDYDHVVGMDVAAEYLESNYPQFMNTDNAEKAVWNLIIEGRQREPSRTSREFHDKIDERLASLMKEAGDNWSPPNPDMPADDEPVAVGSYGDELPFSGAR